MPRGREAKWGRSEETSRKASTRLPPVTAQWENSPRVTGSSDISREARSSGSRVKSPDLHSFLPNPRAERSYGTFLEPE